MPLHYRTLLRPARPFIVAGLIGVAVGLPTRGYAQDSEPPQLSTFSFTPPTIDTTNSDAVVTVTMHVTDQGTGMCLSCSDVPSIQVRFEHPGSGQSRDAYAFTLISGTLNDGVIQGQVAFPQGSASGTWYVAYVFLGDRIGNYVNIRQSELANRGFGTQLENGLRDAVPDIKVNGSDGPVVVGPEQPVRLSLSINAGPHSGTAAEFWLGIATPFGTAWLAPTGWVFSGTPRSLGQFTLSDVPMTVFLDSALPEGVWVPFLILDDTPDGALQATWFDYAFLLSQSSSLTVNPPELLEMERRFLNRIRQLR